MSMKRTKQRASGGARDNDDATNYWAKPTEPDKSWREHVDGKTDDAFTPFALSQRYSKGQLVTHTKFGKGVVVDEDTSKCEILFESGKKKLGHSQPN